MKKIKENLKNVILEVMLPESQAFLKELEEDIEAKNYAEDTIEAKKDLESFIEELNSILTLIDEDKLSNEDAESIYKKITKMLEEHEEHEE